MSTPIDTFIAALPASLADATVAAGPDTGIGVTTTTANIVARVLIRNTEYVASAYLFYLGDATFAVAEVHTQPVQGGRTPEDVDIAMRQGVIAALGTVDLDTLVSDLIARNTFPDLAAVTATARAAARAAANAEVAALVALGECVLRPIAKRVHSTIQRGDDPIPFGVTAGIEVWHNGTHIGYLATSGHAFAL